MKKTALAMAAAGILLALAAARAAQPPAPQVSEDDLKTAGFTNARAVNQSADRYLPPVRYFRVAETVPNPNPRFDCNDCTDLVAVFAASGMDQPSWYLSGAPAVRPSGGRFQVRHYLPDKKTVITVTAPDRDKAVSLSNLLIKKAGG